MNNLNPLSFGHPLIKGNFGPTRAGRALVLIVFIKKSDGFHAGEKLLQQVTLIR